MRILILKREFDVTNISSISDALSEALNFTRASFNALFSERDDANRAQLMTEERL